MKSKLDFEKVSVTDKQTDRRTQLEQEQIYKFKGWVGWGTGAGLGWGCPRQGKGLVWGWRTINWLEQVDILIRDSFDKQEKIIIQK